MKYKELKKIEELIDEYHWNGERLYVIVAYYNLQEFLDIIKDTFEYGYIENAVVYEDGNVGFDDFQDILESLGCDEDPKEIFEDK